MELSPARQLQQWASRKELPCFYFEEVSSTNDAAKENSQILNRPSIWVAEHQTKGRGRGDHSWLDQSGCLLSSWSFPVLSPPQPVFTPKAGLAIWNALHELLSETPLSIKAPNDIYLGSHKVGGLLIDVVSMGTQHQLIVGLGLNLWNHPDIQGAGDLSQWLSSTSTLTKLFEALFQNLTTAAHLSSESTLGEKIRQEILVALKGCPLNPVGLRDVSLRGDLITASDVVPWQRL